MTIFFVIMLLSGTLVVMGFYQNTTKRNRIQMMLLKTYPKIKTNQGLNETEKFFE